MKLYYSGGACSLSPHIVLREAGLPFELVRVDLKTKQLEGGADYKAINGKGQVPTLEFEDGQRLTEGPVIVQYIADRVPTSGLAPAAGTMERYRLQEWLNFISTELHKQFSPLFDAAADDALKARLRERISARFDWVSKQLAGKEHLLGSAFTVADAYLFTILSWTKWVGIDLSKWPVLAGYAARVGARPKVQEALRAEGLGK